MTKNDGIIQLDIIGPNEFRALKIMFKKRLLGTYIIL
jgi:hypothetical protein